MKQKTNTTKRKQIQSNSKIVVQNDTASIALSRTASDIKHSVLLVSLLANLFVLTTWMVAAQDEVYLAQVVRAVW